MTAPAVAAPARRRLALWVAVAATTLALALPIAGGAAGRELRERVLLVAGVALLGVALVRRDGPADQRRLATGALVAVGFAAALLVRDLDPVGVVLLAIAIGSLVWARRE